MDLGRVSSWLRSRSDLGHLSHQEDGAAVFAGGRLAEEVCYIIGQTLKGGAWANASTLSEE